MKKAISKQALIGQAGVNLIEKRLLDMGFVFSPRGPLEAGIDGEFEVRDPRTGEMSGCIVLVQSKATEEPLGSAGRNTFSYTCEERDLDYWMSGNAPVILVRSCTIAGEAFWVSIKDYFADPARRKTRQIVFDRTADAFDASNRERLVRLAVPKDSGLYIRQPERHETLYSSLLPVTSFGPKVFVGATELRPNHVLERLALSNARNQGEWIIRSNQLLSFRDLSVGAWKTICDQGTVEVFEASEWSEAVDKDRERDWVQLLNQTLRTLMRARGVLHDRHIDQFFFAPTRDLSARTIPYKAIVNNTDRAVFRPYVSKKGHVYYRHSALNAKFRRYGGRWFLEIEPTYRFTTDGRSLHPFADSKLKGIKSLENNSAVLGQTTMWAGVISDISDLFARASSFIGFGSLLKFDVPIGFDEKAWADGDGVKEEGGDVELSNEEPGTLPLFAP